VTLLIELKFYGTDLRYIFRYRFHSALTELAFLSKVPLHPVVPQKHLNNFLNRCNEANYSRVLWTIYLSVKTTERSPRPGGGQTCTRSVRPDAPIIAKSRPGPMLAGWTLRPIFLRIGSRLDWHYRYPETFYHITVTRTGLDARWFRDDGRPGADRRAKHPGRCIRLV